MSSISRRVLADLVETRLATLVGVSIYRGEVPDEPPVITTPGGPDPSGRVAPYVVLYTGVGNPRVEADLADANDELAWSFQTRVVAGYDADCGDVTDRVFGLLFRWAPVVDGLAFGRIGPPFGFDPGPVRRQNYPGLPPRFFVPLQWRLDATAD